ncbi:hypothetical protein [Pontibacter sp. G13]|uniref:hypothetical protein n=1 Tax=Pontibacter sp. G13 TaxID=3074898 RepID=UPI00288A0C1D|nr:hypothetical protein [Pontibacter sp. G13]WNJ20116.1 hypothetical protein RJD25_06490 [Pontibacter sp. G13]
MDIRLISISRKYWGWKTVNLLEPYSSKDLLGLFQPILQGAGNRYLTLETFLNRMDQEKTAVKIALIPTGSDPDHPEAFTMDVPSRAFYLTYSETEQAVIKQQIHDALSDLLRKSVSKLPIREAKGIFDFLFPPQEAMSNEFKQVWAVAKKLVEEEAMKSMTNGDITGTSPSQPPLHPDLSGGIVSPIAYPEPPLQATLDCKNRILRYLVYLDQIRDHLSKAKIENSIDMLKGLMGHMGDCCPLVSHSTENLNALLTIQSRFNLYQQAHLEGIISMEEHVRNMGVVTSTLLKFIDRLGTQFKVCRDQVSRAIGST